MELIDLNELLSELKKLDSELSASEIEADNVMGLGVMMAIRKVKDAPTIEAEPVIHAQWEHLVHNKFRCTACERASYVVTVMGKPSYAYCPECGAKMDGGNNEQERTD